MAWCLLEGQADAKSPWSSKTMWTQKRKRELQRQWMHLCTPTAELQRQWMHLCALPLQNCRGSGCTCALPLLPAVQEQALTAALSL